MKKPNFSNSSLWLYGPFLLCLLLAGPARANRYYSTEFGRFVNRDPKKYSDGMNLYAYSKNNPTNTTDPLGLKCEDRHDACQLQEVIWKPKGGTGSPPKTWKYWGKNMFDEHVYIYCKDAGKECEVQGKDCKCVLQLKTGIVIKRKGKKPSPEDYYKCLCLETKCGKQKKETKKKPEEEELVIGPREKPEEELVIEIGPREKKERRKR